MERIMRAQAFSEKQSMGMMMSQKTMELNPRHPISRLLTKVKEKRPTRTRRISLGCAG